MTISKQCTAKSASCPVHNLTLGTLPTNVALPRPDDTDGPVFTHSH